MAAKNSKPKKFKQARKDAKSAAKQTFSGKPQARLKDPMSKLDLVDKEALKEVSKEAKSGYITDERGNKIQTKPVETARERIAREKKTAMEKFRARVAAEDGVPEKKIAQKSATTKKKAPAKKAAATKPAVAKPEVTKMTRAERSAANKAAHAAKRPAELAKLKEAKAASRAAKTAAGADKAIKSIGKTGTKLAKFARPTDASLTAAEDAYLKSKTDELIKKGKLSGSKEIAIRPKGEVVKPGTKAPAVRTANVKPIPGSDKIVKPKGGKLGKIGKGGLILGALTAILDSPNYTKSAKRLAKAQINKFALEHGRDPNFWERNKIALNPTGAGSKMVTNQIWQYFSGGLVGRDASVYADKAEADLKKAYNKKKGFDKPLRYGPNGESLVPGTAAYKKGSATKPKAPVITPSAGGKGGVTPSTSGGATGGGSTGGAKGGKTPSATPGTTYVVKSGDTLSAIAKASGVSLADIRNANKKFSTNPKYKQGNMIWSGTTVKIPTKK